MNTPVLRRVPLVAAEPLWKRAPTRDGEGRAYTDFMMFIPGLRNRPAHLIDQTVHELRRVLTLFHSVVAFAEINLGNNVLWVSLRPGARIRLEVAAAIRARVPEAKLVAANHPYR